MDLESTLQRILIPNAKFGASTSMYINSSLCSVFNNEIIIYPGGIVSFDTYYNSFSTILWKNKCGISHISFKASGYGEAYFRAMLVTDTLARYEIASGIKKLSIASKSLIDIDLSKLKYDGMIYIEILSFSEKIIFKSGEWVTVLRPRRKVNLGITVTHFNRKNYLLPSIARVKNEIINDEKYNELIDFIVIDNSRDITPEESMGIKVIPNDNTGGSGGFMRGLIEYIETGNVTHVLFMDDDVSCEIESIKKTHSILSYAIEDNSAVSGSLFMETRPDVFIEKSGYFDTFCRPIFHGRHLNNIESVIESEMLLKQPNYGAWWFFAFPIKYVKHMAFPFFVRGDDVQFGIINNFNILSTNGIACYSQDFSAKVTPMTRYLDTRSHLLNMFLFNKSSLQIVRTYSTFYISCLLSHQYGSVNTIRIALKHVLGDISFWSENVDMKKIRDVIIKLSEKEKMLKMEIPKEHLDFRGNNESKLRRVIRIITLNGVILPLKKRIIFQEKSYRASLRQIFRYKSICYYDKSTKSGYIAIVSRIKLIKGFLWLFSDCIKIVISRNSQHKKFTESLDNLASYQFWYNLFKIKSNISK